MKSKIINIIAKVIKMTSDEVVHNMNENELWDSFAHLELILAIEDEFDIMFEPDEIAEMKTPQEVVDTIVKKI